MDKGFKFRVRLDGRVVLGVTKVSALKRSTEVTEHREPSDPKHFQKIAGPQEVSEHRIVSRGDA
jgi:hypothetical protein